MKKGFVSMAVVYSFLIVFLVLMASFLASYVNRNRLNNKLVSDTKATLNKNYQNILIYGEDDFSSELTVKEFSGNESVYWCKDNFTVVKDVENYDTEYAELSINYYPDTASFRIEDFSSFCKVNDNQVLPYIETTLIDGSVRSQNICLKYRNNDFCVGRDYIDVPSSSQDMDGYTDMIAYNLTNVFSDLSVNCNNNQYSSSCTINKNSERYISMFFNKSANSCEIKIEKQGEIVIMYIAQGDEFRAMAEYPTNKEHYVYWSYNESHEIGEISNGNIPYASHFTYKSIYGSTNSTLPLIRTKISASNTIGNHEACLRKDGKLFCAKTEWLDYLDEDVNTAITKLKKKIQPLFKNNSITCSEYYGIQCVVDDAASTTITLGSYGYIYIGHGEHYCNANTDDESSCDI